MKKFISQIIFVLILSTVIFAQSDEPKLIDEFGNIPLDDLMSRLDFAMIETQNNIDSKALFRVYGNSLEVGNNPLTRAELIEAYWITTRKFSADKLIIENCFSDEKSARTRVFIKLKNVNLDEPCEKKLSTPQKSILFDKVSFNPNTSKLIPLRNSPLEIGYSENSYSEYSLKVVKKFLDETSQNKIYVISYLGTDSPYNSNEDEKRVKKIEKKSLSKERLKNAKKEILKNGIKVSQIKIIDGGYVDDYGRLEFWFVPKGGEIPKPKPDYFPNKQK